MEENEKIIAQINSISEGSLVDLINVVAADYIVSERNSNDGYAIYQIKPSEMEDTDVVPEEHFYYYLPSSKIVELLSSGKLIHITDIEQYFPLIDDILTELR